MTAADNSVREGDRRYWQSWQDSWDRQQEWYLPDREERFRVMLDRVAESAGPAPRVLDLACGTGSLTGRVLGRLPRARCTGVDLDPALLAIARGHFAGEPRAVFTTADLRDPDWTGVLPHREYDAVLTSTALHWLRTEPLRALYRELAGLLRPGGLFLNADHMPDPATPRINEADEAATRRRQARLPDGVLDWQGWWRAAGADDRLAAAVAKRATLYREHSDGEPHAPEWHAAALCEAGFGEARAIWRSRADAIVLAVR